MLHNFSARRGVLAVVAALLAICWLMPQPAFAQDPVGGWDLKLSPVGRRGESLDLKITVDSLQIKNYIGDPGFLNNNLGELLFVVFVAREEGAQRSAKLVFPGEEAIEIRVGDILNLRDFSIVANNVRPTETVHVVFWALDSDNLAAADSRTVNVASEFVLQVFENKVHDFKLARRGPATLKSTLGAAPKFLGFVAGAIGGAIADELLASLEEDDELGYLYASLDPSSGWYVNQTLTGTSPDGNMTLQFGVTNNQSECVYNAETCAEFIASQAPSPRAALPPAEPSTPAPTDSTPSVAGPTTPPPGSAPGVDSTAEATKPDEASSASSASPRSDSGTGPAATSSGASPSASAGAEASSANSPSAVASAPSLLPSTGASKVPWRFARIYAE